MLSACIMVYMLVADGEPGAQCVSIATKYDQAAIVYKAARKIVEQDRNWTPWCAPLWAAWVQADEQHHEGPGVKSKTLDGLNLRILQLRRGCTRRRTGTCTTSRSRA